MSISKLVSVIVPNYNHENYLKQRLESVFKQTYQDFEVIILDDCSTDNSREIIKEYESHPKVSEVRINEVNTGSTFKQWNKGIEMAKGEYIWIAESDDYCEPDFLSTLLKMYSSNPSLSLVYCQSFRVNSKGEIKGTWLNHTKDLSTTQFTTDFIMDGNNFIENFLIHKNVIPNVSGVLFSKKSLQKITPLKIKPYLKYNADWFYYIQLSCNARVGFISKPLNYFRFHPESVIANAGNNSGWLNIFRMEIKGRKKMLSYLNKSKPPNLKSITEQSRRGGNELYFLTAKGYINKNEYFKAFQIVWNNPFVFKRTIKYYLTK